MIVALLDQKGGVGKTTLASQFASRSTREERRIAVIDAGPQGPALDWSAYCAAATSTAHLASSTFPVTRHIASHPSPSDYSDRLVTDGPSALCRPIKIAAFQRGVADVDVPRDFPARDFPDIDGERS